MRATARICGVGINTVARLLREIGPLADQYHHENVGIGQDSASAPPARRVWRLSEVVHVEKRALDGPHDVVGFVVPDAGFPLPLFSQRMALSWGREPERRAPGCRAAFRPTVLAGC